MQLSAVPEVLDDSYCNRNSNNEAETYMFICLFLYVYLLHMINSAITFHTMVRNANW